MTIIAFYEARTRLSELLDQVGQGQKILITRHGKPAALLMPPEPERKDARQLIADFKAYSKRQARTLGGISARELIEEGRRF